MSIYSKIASFVIAISISAMLISSCTKNDESTIVLLGEEQYIDEMLDVIPDSLIDAFLTTCNIYKGYFPPNIQGEFLFSKKQRVLTSIDVAHWPLNVIEPDVCLKFSDQHNRVATFVHREQVNTETDTVYVIGRESYFTVYYKEYIVLDYIQYDVKITRGIIYSGRLMEDGIRNLHYASIIMDVVDESNGHGNHETQPVGTFFIYKDKDGLSEYYDWYNEGD